MAPWSGPIAVILAGLQEDLAARSAQHHARQSGWGWADRDREPVGTEPGGDAVGIAGDLQALDRYRARWVAGRGPARKRRPFLPFDEQRQRWLGDGLLGAGQSPP